MLERRMDTERGTNHIDPEEIISLLGKSIFSNNIVFYEKIYSTNTHAKELAKKGAPEGTVVLAEEQTAGKGRMDRRWLSPGYKNILVSILLRPLLPLDKIFVLTMILALAVIDTIKEKYKLNAMIKWPNDIYIDYRKLGGILTEFSVKDIGVEYVILGLGLNVNWKPEEEDGLLYPATSIMTETGSKVSRNELISDILIRFEEYYRDVLSGRIDPLYCKWNDLSLVMGKKVTIQSYEEKFRGTAIRIDHQGALVIRRADGEEQKILSGDVSLRL